ncbi:MAG: hypothetical protein LQ337_002642 [Flavoplaca oasis]|nr:MAG: hypothetical protein LQ337_002642 [Flavoplaca oasis]
MARKKKAQKQTKRLEVTGPDGWTHIIKGLKSVHLNKCSTRLANQPPEVPPNQTLADLRKTHAKYRNQWLSSPSYREIQRLFLEEVIPALTSVEKKDNGRIDRCVMLGLGSLSNGQRSSWWELVFLESVLALLSFSSTSTAISNIPVGTPAPTPTANESTANPSSSPLPSTPPKPQHTTPPIPISIQDPIFNPLDITYLSESLNFTVLNHPAAFSEITPSTFLFAPHLEMELYARALGAPTGHAGPRLIVGTDVMECIDQLRMKLGEREGEEEAERRRQERVFLGYKDAMAGERLPGFEKDDWMGFTHIYWKKPEDARDNTNVEN